MTKKIDRQVVAYAVIDTSSGKPIDFESTRKQARDTKKVREIYNVGTTFKIIKLKGDEIVR